MACPHCNHAALMSIEMRLKGSGVTLRLCGECEQRWWERGDDRVSLDEVLVLVAA